MQVRWRRNMEAKIKQLEIITQRLMRRSKRVARAMITPYPISNAVIGDKVDGVILRYMFPCKGKIVKGGIDFGKKPKQEVTVTISLFGAELGGSRSFVLTKRRVAVEPNLNVEALDKLEVSISYQSEKPENDITEVWASLLWIPSVADVDIKNFLIEELENDYIEESEGLNKQLSSGDGGGE